MPGGSVIKYAPIISPLFPVLSVRATTRQLESRWFRLHHTSMDAVPTRKVKDLTLVFCRREAPDGTGKQVLLGLKKRGFGKGKWNGFGGKVEQGETVDVAAKRELLEECGVTADALSLRGQLTFHVPSYPSTMRVFVYEATSHSGDPIESDEMRPQWYKETCLPFKDMWADDKFWLPLFLTGKCFRGEFNFSDDQTIVDHSLREVSSSDALRE